MNTAPIDAPDAPIDVPTSIPITSNLATYALQFSFGLNLVKRAIIDVLGEVPVLAVSGDPRLERQIDDKLRRCLGAINEMTGAGNPQCRNSSQPVPVPPGRQREQVQHRMV